MARNKRFSQQDWRAIARALQGGSQRYARADVTRLANLGLNAAARVVKSIRALLTGRRARLAPSERREAAEVLRELPWARPAEPPFAEPVEDFPFAEPVSDDIQSPPAPGQPPDGGGRGRGKRGRGGGGGGDRRGFDTGVEMLRAGGSSNVWSYGYDPNTSTLYVTYLAPRLRKSKVSRHPSGSLIAEAGAIKGKRNAPGATYSYLDVPARAFKRMKVAASKGKFIWDELRIRGTIYGHKYRYVIISGAQAGGGIYVPRKATKRGFVFRSVAAPGKGRRSAFAASLAPREIKGINSIPAPGADKRRGGYGL
mgnify:CR=1 FL=1